MSSIIDENDYYGGEQDVTEAVKIRLYPTREQKKKINSSRKIFPFKPKMQQLRIPIHGFRIKRRRMEMS